MMSNLHELIPGSEHWPHFVRNRSEQFEARLVLAGSAAFTLAVLCRDAGQSHTGGDSRMARAMPSFEMPPSRPPPTRW